MANESFFFTHYNASIITAFSFFKNFIYFHLFRHEKFY